MPQFDEKAFTERLSQCSETEVFLVVRTLSDALHQWRQANRGQTDPHGLRKPLEIAQAAAGRFGVKLDWDGDYRCWFQWWNHYIKQMSEEDFRKLEHDMLEGVDMSTWRPKGAWQLMRGEDGNPS